MPFVEVFTPRGSLSDARRAQVAERLVAEVMRAEGAPDTPAARSISWLVWQEIDAWWVGGRPVGAGEAPRYVVRVAIPAGSLDDHKRRDMVERVTGVLAAAEDDPGRLQREPVAWVHLNEIPEGNWGAMGRVMHFADIAAFVVAADAPEPRLGAES
jgi:phenylpyruvate tautomerase PptA (4-oxalocrotonate tautomerase family)